MMSSSFSSGWWSYSSRSRSSSSSADVENPNDRSDVSMSTSNSIRLFPFFSRIAQLLGLEEQHPPVPRPLEQVLVVEEAVVVETELGLHLPHFPVALDDLDVLHGLVLLVFIQRFLGVLL